MYDFNDMVRAIPQARERVSAKELELMMERIYKEVTPEEFERHLKEPCPVCGHAPHYMSYNDVVFRTHCSVEAGTGKRCACGGSADKENIVPRTISWNSDMPYPTG